MTGVSLQSTKQSSAQSKQRGRISYGLLSCLILAVAAMAGCQNLAPSLLTAPDPILDATQLENVRFQSPGGSGSRGGGGGGSGTQGPATLLNNESHRLKLDGPVINLENADQSQLISAVIFQGNTTLATHHLKRHISTRAGRYYDPDKLQQDVKTLWKMPEIAKVNGPFIDQRPDGIVITIDIEERRSAGTIDFIGNRSVADKTLLRESGLEDVAHHDVHKIRIAKTRLEEYYRAQGYPRTQVEIREGNEATDSHVTFLVHEDRQQRIWKVDFEGNTLASDARLKSQIQAKPGIMKIFGGLAEKKKIDQDIVRLEAYYKSLGYFNVQIGREIEESNDGRWLNVRFIINEGPRYRVREVRFVGNERYQSSDLIQLLTFKPDEGGQPEFNSTSMSEDLTALRDLYGANGYVYADVKAEPRFLEEPGYIDMVYRISEGEQYRVGKINVNYNGGNGITRREVVLNRLSLRPGDLIDSRKLRGDERRLASARIFATGQETGGTPPRIVVSPPENGSEFDRITGKEPKPAGSGSRSSGSGSRSSAPPSGSGTRVSSGPPPGGSGSRGGPPSGSGSRY